MKTRSNLLLPQRRIEEWMNMSINGDITKLVSMNESGISECIYCLERIDIPSFSHMKCDW